MMIAITCMMMSHDNYDDHHYTYDDNRDNYDDIIIFIIINLFNVGDYRKITSKQVYNLNLLQ